MKHQSLLSALVVSLAMWFSVLTLPALAQQVQGRAAYGPPQQLARGGNQVVPGAAPAAANVAPMPMAPKWFPLAPNHQQYLDSLLSYWEQKSSQIKRYRCTFKRWEYDAVFGPADTFKTYSEGVIKYSAPDKGLFRIDTLKEYRAPKNPGDRPTYEAPEEPTASFNHWICDGTCVYEFDPRQKKLLQYQLPPEARGQAIGKGPLPFLFNAKADDIKQRFWIHVITPPNTKGEYWLEAVPKTQEDAANFMFIHIIIDEQDYLPKAMVLFLPSANNVAGAPLSKTTFSFEGREVNFSVLAEQLNLFHREFYEPKLPTGWTREVIPAGQASAPQDLSAGRAPAESADATRR